MLKAKQNNTGQIVRAKDVARSDGPFSCPAGNHKVHLRKGRVRVDHFLHESGSNCPVGTGESEEHLATKEGIEEALKAQGIYAESEEAIGNRYADVHFICEDKSFVVEVQRSTISVDELEGRYRDYTNAKCAVIWVLTGLPPKHDTEIRVPAWQRIVHAAQGHMVFYWSRGIKLQPVHFLKVARYNAGAEWYDRDAGEEIVIHGHHRTLKETRQVVLAPFTVSITDLVPRRAGRACYWAATIAQNEHRWWLRREYPHVEIKQAYHDGWLVAELRTEREAFALLEQRRLYRQPSMGASIMYQSVKSPNTQKLFSDLRSTGVDIYDPQD